MQRCSHRRPPPTVDVPPTPRAEPVSRAVPVVAPSAPAIDNANVVRLTDEIRSNLYKTEPLIRAVIDQLGGSIVRLEEG